MVPMTVALPPSLITNCLDLPNGIIPQFSKHAPKKKTIIKIAQTYNTVNYFMSKVKQRAFLIFGK